MLGRPCNRRRCPPIEFEGALLRRAQAGSRRLLSTAAGPWAIAHFHLGSNRNTSASGPPIGQGRSCTMSEALASSVRGKRILNPGRNGRMPPQRVKIIGRISLGSNLLRHSLRLSLIVHNGSSVVMVRSRIGFGLMILAGRCVAPLQFLHPLF